MLLSLSLRSSCGIITDMRHDHMQETRRGLIEAANGATESQCWDRHGATEATFGTQIANTAFWKILTLPIETLP